MTASAPPIIRAQPARARNRDQRDRADNRADARRRHEIAEAIRPHLQHIAHIERHHDRDRGENKNRHRSDHPDHREAWFIRPDVAETVFDSARALRFFFLAPDRARRQREQRDDEGEKSKRSWRKTPSPRPTPRQPPRRPTDRPVARNEKPRDRARPRRRFPRASPVPGTSAESAGCSKAKAMPNNPATVMMCQIWICPLKMR